MRLREYRASDLSAITDICSICNVDDTLSRYMTKDIFDNWTSYRNATLRWLRNLIASPGVVAYVVDIETKDKPTKQSEKSWTAGQVVGWSIWSRTGSSKTAREWQKKNETWTMKLEQSLNMLEAKTYDWIPRLNPTWDFEHNKQIRPLLNDGGWDTSIFAEAWILNGLYIDVDWQRQGIGSMLIQRGLEQAQKEHVPAVVGASPKGIGAYERNGFRPVRRIDFDQFFEVGGRGIWQLVWEPKGRAGNWYERALELDKDKEQENVAKKNGVKGS